ncbi:class I SAM-dependent methyltransferase, partial [Candidatus Pelagibacter sp.]|nr:class I SAM-dependent methyltransferase [Candidatus Pelagibacter sp.]
TINTKNEMGSEHEEFFSALSINKNQKINNILEIGTYDGFNSLLLSNLFLYSNIDTIDLPENDNDFINFYGRKDQVDQFVKKRNSVISKNKNINFFSQNSLNLLNFKKKYDLIWIDGAHGYPVVCIDIINSLHVLNENGIIMCDDVQISLHRNSPDKMFHSLATIETLNELKKCNLIEFKLMYKRLNAKNNCDEKKRKFIAVINKL